METVVGGLFNAVVFAGAGFLFSKLNHSGYVKEEKRHDEAIEELARDKEKWYEKQVEKKEEIEKLEKKLSYANADINKTNMSLKKLAEINNRYKYLKEEYEKSEPPKLEDYYKPSDEMKDYQNVSFFLVGISGGYLVYKFI